MCSWLPRTAQLSALSELNQRIRTRLTQLQQFDPSIKLTPLGNVHLGANDASLPEKAEIRCDTCFMIHNGELPVAGAGTGATAVG